MIIICNCAMVSDEPCPMHGERPETDITSSEEELENKDEIEEK